MISCPSCKKEIADSARRCPNCGHDFIALDMRIIGLIVVIFLVGILISQQLH